MKDKIISSCPVFKWLSRFASGPSESSKQFATVCTFF